MVYASLHAFIAWATVGIGLLFLAKRHLRRRYHPLSHNVSACSEVRELLKRRDQACGSGAGSLFHRFGRRLVGPAPKHKHQTPRVKCYVMLPLDTVHKTKNGRVQLNGVDEISAALSLLAASGVTGVMVDVWWGLVERSAKVYDFGAYRQLAALVHWHGLKLQAVMSFHKCGGNVGDNFSVELPEWLAEAGDDIFFCDREGNRSMEYLSFAVDELPIFGGRTPLQLYADFMAAFAREVVAPYASVISEVEIGLGPCGEIRYPSYRLSEGWEFPGVGTFMCYDTHMMARLEGHCAAKNVDIRAVLERLEHVGHQKTRPNNDSEYFSDIGGCFGVGGGWATVEGRLFQEWYSEQLLCHAESVMGHAARIFNSSVVCVPIAAKVAGIHWWYKFASHAAESTAGYSNADDGPSTYEAIARLLSRFGAHLNFTCLEMRNDEQPTDAACGPVELVQQVARAARKFGVAFCGENALLRLDDRAFLQVIEQSRELHTFTFLRLTAEMFDKSNFDTFSRFVGALSGPLPKHLQERDEKGNLGTAQSMGAERHGQRLPDPTKRPRPTVS